MMEMAEWVNEGEENEEEGKEETGEEILMYFMKEMHKSANSFLINFQFSIFNFNSIIS